MVDTEPHILTVCDGRDGAAGHTAQHTQSAAQSDAGSEGCDVRPSGVDGCPGDSRSSTTRFRCVRWFLVADNNISKESRSRPSPRQRQKKRARPPGRQCSRFSRCVDDKHEPPAHLRG